jgi:hypothetical protein
MKWLSKKWLTNQEFLDLLGATNLIPGPNSTEMAIHIGQERALERTITGLCFIVPAVLLTGFLPTVIKNMVNYLSYNLFFIWYQTSNNCSHPELFILWQKVVKNRFTRNHCRSSFTIVTICKSMKSFCSLVPVC